MKREGKDRKTPRESDERKKRLRRRAKKKTTGKIHITLSRKMKSRATVRVIWCILMRAGRLQHISFPEVGSSRSLRWRMDLWEFIKPIKGVACAAKKVQWRNKENKSNSAGTKCVKNNKDTNSVGCRPRRRSVSWFQQQNAVFHFTSLASHSLWVQSTVGAPGGLQPL